MWQNSKKNAKIDGAKIASNIKQPNIMFSQEATQPLE